MDGTIMNILLAFYPIDDMGGIINHNEQLCAGLLELGHTVDTKCFIPRSDWPRDGLAGGRGESSPYTGLEYDQRRGYSWKNKDLVPYVGKGLPFAVSLISNYDLVIWQVAVPTKRKENKGNSDWLALYQTGVKQLAVIHDGNFLASYPWLERVSDTLSGIACVHHCAFNSAQHINVPSSLIVNPQEVKYPDLSPAAWEHRSRGFLSLQTFKAWKHVPELVAAMAHTKKCEMHLAGKGIDYYYLTSKDKCKWPDIWDAAMANGMHYHGVVTNDERDSLLMQLTCLVDPSWSRKYSAIGGHFNRVLVDGIMCGAVPIVRPLGISTNLDGQGELFQVGKNCLSIPMSATPEQYGEDLDYYCNMDYHLYLNIMQEAVKLLPMFDRKRVAAEFIDLIDFSQQRGHTTQRVIDDSNKVMKEFFNG